MWLVATILNSIGLVPNNKFLIFVTHSGSVSLLNPDMGGNWCPCAEEHADGKPAL